jgi:SAM-dependent methyltransferase
MEKQAYQDMIFQQTSHWWFKARREVLSTVLTSLSLPVNAEILEIGCGMGGNIPMLQQHGSVSAVEMDDFALAYTKKTYDISAHKGHLPDKINCSGHYNLICLFDVLEHVKEDDQALLTVSTLLAPNGYLLITVPAYQWLFGAHDRLLHHFRRYTRESLLRKLRRANLMVLYSTYFNSLLFPLFAIVRLYDSIKPGSNSTGYGVPPPLINSLLYHIFRQERLVIPNIAVPFGSSILALAKPKLS